MQSPFPSEAEAVPDPPALATGAGPDPEFELLALEAGAEPPAQAERMNTRITRADAKPVGVRGNLRMIILYFLDACHRKYMVSTKGYTTIKIIIIIFIFNIALSH
jgi:hypothetical protein